MAFNLVAQLQIQTPSNLGKLASDIQAKLRNISATVNLQINPTSVSGLNALNQQIVALNVNLKALVANSTAASSSLSKLGSGFSSSSASAASSSKSIASVSNSIYNYNKAATEATNATEEFGRAAGLAGRRFLGFSLVAGTVVGTIAAIKNGFNEALKFEREFIKLTQVGTSTKAELSELNNEITRLSTTLGVSSKDLVATSVTLRQAGLTVKEVTAAMEVLAKTTLAPTFDNIKDTTEGAIAVMAQFRLEAKDLEQALGSANAVAAAFAVESKDIITAVQKSGGAFKSVGGDLNEFIALFTSVRATTRESADSIATGLRTVFTRLQRKDTVEALRELGVNLRYTRQEAIALGDANLETQFVGAYEAVRRLSEALKDVRSTDPRYSEVVEQLGGYRQISKVLPLLQQFQTSQKALNIAQSGFNSITTSAEEAQAAFLVKLTKVKEEFLALARTIASSNAFQGFLDTSLKLAKAFISITDALSPLIPLLTTLTTIRLASNLTSFFSGVTQGFSGVGPKKLATGGVVPGYGNGDTVPAMLTPGEFVINKRAAQSIGYGKLGKINKYADGGQVFKVGNYDLSPNNVKWLYALADAKDKGAKLLSNQANQKVLAKILGPSENGSYTSANEVFKKLGFASNSKTGVVQSLTELRKTLGENKEFRTDRGEATKTGKYVKDGKLIIPFAGETVGYVTSGTAGGEAGKQGRDVLNAGLRVENLGSANIGGKSNRTVKALLDAGGVKTVSGGVNVHVLSSQPTQDFQQDIIGNLNNSIQGIFTNKFGGSRVNKLSDSQINSITGYMFEKYIEGLSGRFTAGNGTDFEYSKGKRPGSTLGKAFDKFVFPGPVNESFLDVKSRYSRENNADIVKKYLNVKSRDGGLASAIGVKLGAPGAPSSPAKNKSTDDSFSELRLATGGIVPGYGNGDTVPAKLTPGEFVIRKSSAKAIGYDNLSKMNKYASGGAVIKLGKQDDYAGLFLDNKAGTSGKAAASTISIDLNDVKGGNAEPIIRNDKIRAGVRDNLGLPVGSYATVRLFATAGGYKPFDTRLAKSYNTIIPVRLSGNPTSYLLNAKRGADFEKAVNPKVSDAAEFGTQDLLSGTGLPNINKIAKDARSNVLKIGERGILGYMFESSLLSLSNTASQIANRGANDRFDIVNPNKTKLNTLFGGVKENYLDVKAGLNYTNRASLINKASSLAAKNVIETSLDLGQSNFSSAKSDFFKENVKFNALRKAKGLPYKPGPGYAKGGLIGYADGGFVLNQAAVDKAFDELKDEHGIDFRRASKKVVIGDFTKNQNVADSDGFFNPNNKILALNKASITDAKQLKDLITHESLHGFDNLIGERKTGVKGAFASTLEKGVFANATASALEVTKDRLNEAGISKFSSTGRYLTNPKEAYATNVGNYLSNDKDSGYLTTNDEYLTGKSSDVGARISAQGAVNTRTKNVEKTLSLIKRTNLKFALGGSNQDSVPAMLTPGEFVISKRSASNIGLANLNYMNQTGKIRGYNSGGYVKNFATGDTVAKPTKPTGEVPLVYADRSASSVPTREVLLNLKEIATFQKRASDAMVRAEADLKVLASSRQANVVQASAIAARGGDTSTINAIIDRQIAKEKELQAEATRAANNLTRLNDTLKTLSNRALAAGVNAEEVKAGFRYGGGSLSGTGTFVHNDNLLAAPTTAAPERRSLLNRFSLGLLGRGAGAPLTDEELSARQARSQRLQTAALFGGSLIASYGGQQFENKQESFDLAAKTGETSRVKSNASIGGALTGAAAGAAVGSIFGPLGIAVGAFAGGIYGAVDGLKDAEKQIREAKIGKALTDLSLIIENVNKSSNFTAEDRTKILSEINTVKTANQEKASEESSTRIGRFLGLTNESRTGRVFGSGFDTTKYLQATESFNRQTIGKELPGIYEILGRESLKLGQNLAKTSGTVNLSSDNIKTTLEQLDSSFIESNRDLLQVIADFKKTSVGEVAKDFTRQRAEGFTSQRRQEFATKASIDIGQQLGSFNRLSVLVEQTADNMKKLEVASINLNDAFEGTISNVLNTNFNKEYITNTEGIGGALGKEGAALSSFASDFSIIKDKLTSVLPDVLSKPGLEGQNIELKIREALEKGLGGLNDQQKAIINSITKAVGEEGLDKLRASARTNTGATISKLLSESNPSDEFNKISTILADNANKFVSELIKYQNRIQKTGEQEDKLRQIQLTKIRFINDRLAEQFGEKNGALDRLSVQALNAPITQRAERLTGLGKNSEDVESIVNKLASLKNQIDETTQSQQKNFDSNRFATDASRQAAEKLVDLKRQSADLQLALKELTDVSTRNAAIQEKLSKIQEDRSSRLSFGERFLRAGNAERADINRGVLLANQAATAGNLNGFSNKNINSILNTLESLGNAKVNLGGREQRASDVKTNLLENTFGGVFTPKQETKDEERELRELERKNIETAEAAQKALISDSRSNNDAFISDLRGLQNQFFANLNASFRNEAINKEKQKLNAANIEKGTLESSDEAKNRKKITDVLGTNVKQSQVDLLKSRTGEFSALFGLDKNIKELSSRLTIGDKKFGGFAINGQEDKRANFSLSKAQFALGEDSRFVNTEDFKKVLSSIVSQETAGTGLDVGKLVEQIAEKSTAFSALGQTSLFGEGKAGYEATVNSNIERVIAQALTEKLNTSINQRNELGGNLKAQVGEETFNKVNNFQTSGKNFADFSKALESFNATNPIEEFSKKIKSLADIISETERIISSKKTENAALVQPSVNPIEYGLKLGTVIGKAAGGFIPKGTDTVPAMLTPGEFIVNAKAASANKGLLENINSGTKYFAEGGFVNKFVNRAKNQLGVVNKDDPLYVKLAGLSPEDLDISYQQARTEAAKLIAIRNKKFSLDIGKINKSKIKDVVKLQQITDFTKKLTADTANTFGVTLTETPDKINYILSQPDFIKKIIGTNADIRQRDFANYDALDGKALLKKYVNEVVPYIDNQRIRADRQSKAIALQEKKNPNLVNDTSFIVRKNAVNTYLDELNNQQLYPSKNQAFKFNLDKGSPERDLLLNAIKTAYKGPTISVFKEQEIPFVDNKQLKVKRDIQQNLNNKIANQEKVRENAKKKKEDELDELLNQREKIFSEINKAPFTIDAQRQANKITDLVTRKGGEVGELSNPKIIAEEAIKLATARIKEKAGKALNVGDFGGGGDFGDQTLDNIPNIDDIINLAKSIGFATGGSVPGVGHGDTVPAMLTPGEFVLNRTAANAIGLSTLHKMNSVGKTQNYAAGGPVRGNNINDVGQVLNATDFSQAVSRFENSLTILRTAFTAFDNSANALAQAMQKFPSTITGNFTHAVNVNITGAEALAALSPELEKIAVSKAKQVLSNYVKANLSEAGPVE